MVRASVSQSVERTVQILALFEAERRPLPRLFIADALDMPRSSVAALLQGLTELDILLLDRRTQTYFPTARLGRLAGWIDQLFSVDPQVLALAKQLQQATLETVTLATPLNQALEVIDVELGLHPVSYIATVGQVVPLWASAVGYACLSMESDKTIAEMHRRSAPGDTAAPSPAALATIMDAVRKTRADGYALYIGSVASDAATIAAPLPLPEGARALAVAISGPTSRIVANERELAREMKRAIESLNTSHR
ncbi:IclR family transcriptional regulator [Novosphingobium sp.]|uniref:IclR family transcriptional regulator n=1 Tax=Novosphingobium sp. TaxID=1874826 RepID=UPI00352B18BD